MSVNVHVDDKLKHRQLSSDKKHSTNNRREHDMRQNNNAGHTKENRRRPRYRQYNLNIPIYRRCSYKRKKEVVVPSAEDDKLAWSRLDCTDQKECYYQSHGSLFHWGYPRLLIVGSPHVNHLAAARADGNVPE